jgi:hypothetical protein
MAKLDVTRTNDAITRLLESTTNPRHRYLLTTYYRHRYLEIAGRFEEIFMPAMTVDDPVYHFQLAGVDTTLRGAEAVKGLYRGWAETHQSIFATDDEQVAVSDNYVVSIATLRQQVYGKALAARGIKVDDEGAHYVYANVIQMIWPYDDRCRMIGEDVYEPEPGNARLTKLAPPDVLTTEESGRILAPYIKPLPPFDPKLHGRAQ